MIDCNKRINVFPPILLVSRYKCVAACFAVVAPTWNFSTINCSASMLLKSSVSSVASFIPCNVDSSFTKCSNDVAFFFFFFREATPPPDAALCLDIAVSLSCLIRLLLCVMVGAYGSASTNILGTRSESIGNSGDQRIMSPLCEDVGKGKSHVRPA